MDIFNEACRELPEGWRIAVYLDRGSGCVELEDDDGEDVYFDGQYEGPVEQQIHAALAAAKAFAK